MYRRRRKVIEIFMQRPLADEAVTPPLVALPLFYHTGALQNHAFWSFLQLSSPAASHVSFFIEDPTGRDVQMTEQRGATRQLKISITDNGKTRIILNKSRTTLTPQPQGKPKPWPKTHTSQNSLGWLFSGSLAWNWRRKSQNVWKLKK